jgi:Hemolysins and related proteins containing CBS domains
LAGWLDAPETLLATILLGNNFASIGAATVSAALVSRLVMNPQKVEIALGIEAVLLTLFILLFCELGPKALAARYPERISLQIVVPIAVCMKLLYPPLDWESRSPEFFTNMFRTPRDLRPTLQAMGSFER